MSKLYFTPVDQAFTMGSTQIKDSQEEIAHLTKLILDSSKKKADRPERRHESAEPVEPAKNYMRVGYPDQQTAVFRPPHPESIDYNLMKVIGHPKFDDIVKNYVLMNHPDWLLSETVYRPQASRSNFGNRYSSTVCSDIQRYLIFFVACIVIFLTLSVTL